MKTKVSQKQPRIDWLKAERLYIQNPTIGYRGVAAEIGAGLRSVATQAKRGDWVTKRQHYCDTRREAAERQAEKDGAKVVQQTERDIREVGEILIAKAKRALAKLPDEEVQKWAATQGPFKEAAKVLMLLAGLPTERQEVETRRTGLEEKSEEEMSKLDAWLNEQVWGDGDGRPPIG